MRKIKNLKGIVLAGVLPQDDLFEAHKQLAHMQPGDVPTTYADATALEREFGFRPRSHFAKASATLPSGTWSTTDRK